MSKKNKILSILVMIIISITTCIQLSSKINEPRTATIPVEHKQNRTDNTGLSNLDKAVWFSL